VGEEVIEDRESRINSQSLNGMACGEIAIEEVWFEFADPRFSILDPRFINI